MSGMVYQEIRPTLCWSFFVYLFFFSILLERVTMPQNNTFSMGLGNGNSNQGNKGSNFNYELRHLLLLGQVINSLAPVNSLATEATLAQVLVSLQNGAEYEAMLIADNNGVAWLEVRIFNSITHTFNAPVYYLAGSNIVGTPATPIHYINPSSYLASIVSNTTGLNLEATQQSSLTKLTTISTKDFATQTTLAAVAKDSNLTKLTVNRIPKTFYGTGTVTIPIGATEITVKNFGTGTAALVNLVTFPAGAEAKFGFRNPISVAIIANGGGTENLLINYMG